MTFLTEDFLLTNPIAIELYHNYAKEQPIFDYHSHLSPQLIADDYQFTNLYDVWLKGDHYKWRAMRTNGITEEYCTGNKSDYKKYLAYAQSVPYMLGNPLYHWTHLELKRYFNISDQLLNGESAAEIWKTCNTLLQEPQYSARNLLLKMNVKMVGTTDDPLDDLQAHQKIAADLQFNIKVLPTFRPDKILAIEAPAFTAYVKKLMSITDMDIQNFRQLTVALEKRMDYFALHGCVISDHSLEEVAYMDASEKTLTQILQRRLAGAELTPTEAIQFKSQLLIFLGTAYHQRNWVQQYHIGALRNNNTRLLNRLGRDIGCDSINDRSIATPLSQILDAQDQQNALPKTILYCLNPSDNEVIATMAGNFQGDGIPGKIQFGSGWWFNDQKDGIQRQLTQLSQLGLLSRFVGMLTDSRSFLSFTRHEYFRRILCNMVGQWVVDGEAPNDMALLGSLIKNICYDNAKHYFGQ